jgi:hypothetical protein
MVSKKSYDVLMKNGGVSMSAMFLIITIGIIVNLLFAWTLLTISMYFVGRILGLWFAMIFAPLAFVTNIVPALGSKLPKVGWKDWVKNLTDLAIMAPIFVFFMFLIIAFLQSGFMSSMLQSSNPNVSTTEFLISIVLQFMLIIGLLKTAEATTKKLSGQFGESVAGVAGGIAKFAGGAALGLGAGALALGGRSVLGKFMGKADTAGARENATKTGMRGWMARRQLDIADAGKKGSFDLRQNTIASTLSQKAGLNLNTGTGIPGLGRFNTANTAGGLEGARTREQIRLEKRAEKYGRVDKDASHNIEHTIEERKERIEAAENMVEQKQAELNLAKGTPRADAAERDLGAAKEALRQAKNGTGALAVLGATRADGKTVTADDVARGAKSTEGMGLKDLEKLLETNKKARAREFLAERQKKYADGNIVGEKRDALGNIVKFGHLDKAAAAASSSYMARNFLRETWRGMSGGAGMGAIVAGAFTGGIGLVGGAAIGAAVSGGLRGTLANYFAQTNSALSATEEAIHSAMATGKDAHAAHPPKDSYKGPAGDFFTKLFGAFKQNDHGGGGGNDDHGHDDHGSHGGH